MSPTDIGYCIEILNEKPKWFFQKENIAGKLQCFDTIQRVGTTSAIYSLIGFLKSDNILVQTKAAETVLYLFEKLKSLNDYANTLKHLMVKKSDLDRYKANFDESTYVQLLGIASLNGNGYLREKAVKELARIKNADGLKFILLRLGDWVAAVREVATTAVSSFLEDAYTDDLLKQLPTIDQLLKIERMDLSQIHQRIIQFIVNQEFSEDFYHKIRRLDDRIRVRFYKNFLAHKHPTREQVYRIIADRNFLVRAELLKYLTRFDQAIQKELLGRFLQDQSSVVRLKALYASKNFSPVFEDQITVLLSDEAASVRELSRHLLKNNGIDFAQYYRQSIADKRFLSGSLLGLSETGNEEDLSTFEQYIHSGKNKLVVASLTAINKFSPDSAKNYALALLAHGSTKVRNKAVETLAKSNESQILERIRDIYTQGGHEIKRTVLTLFNRIGGWNIIGDLLLALTDENISIQNLAWQLLEKWKLKATRLFTTKSKAELERANQLYNHLDLSKLKMNSDRMNLLQDLKFYLR